MKNSEAEPFCFKPPTVLCCQWCDVQEAVSVDADQARFALGCWYLRRWSLVC
jgi:hypothetical protein